MLWGLGECKRKEFLLKKSQLVLFQLYLLSCLGCDSGNDMAIDANVTSVEPTGLGRVLFATSVFFLIPTSIVVALRCVIRLKHHIFGMDDGLMLFGWVGSIFSSFHI
jgi:hypothetical protein